MATGRACDARGDLGLWMGQPYGEKMGVAAARGDLFEIILIQVKGGTAKFPSPEDIARLVYVKEHHRADKVVLTEWKRGERMCCYLLPDTIHAVPAGAIFGNVPNTKRDAPPH